IAEDKEQYGAYSPPQTPGMVTVQGHDRLLKQITDNPNATWATEVMLAAEKNFQDKGGNIKEYLNTTWLWLESGSRHWADPYQVNCDDIGQPAQWKTGRHCQGALMQSSGFQAWDRQND